MSINPTREAIEIFLEIKRILDDIKGDDVGSKLRTRAREVPEMMADLGLVPTLSFCLAKAGIDNMVLVFGLISDSSTSPNKLRDVEPEKLAYALYTYAIMKYLNKILNIQPSIEELKRLGREFRELSEEIEKLNKEVKKKKEEELKKLKEEFENKLYEYLNELVQSNTAAIASRLLYSYLIQFKRLCEATFGSEEERKISR